MTGRAGRDGVDSKGICLILTTSNNTVSFSLNFIMYEKAHKLKKDTSSLSLSLSGFSAKSQF